MKIQRPSARSSDASVRTDSSDPELSDDNRILSRGRILVIEGQPSIALGMCQDVAAWGYEVCGVAASVADALEKAGDLGPDVAIVKVSPVVDSASGPAAQSIREPPSFPIVFLGADDGGSAAATDGAAIDAKPYDDAALKAAIGQALRDAR